MLPAGNLARYSSFITGHKWKLQCCAAMRCDACDAAPAAVWPAAACRVRLHASLTEPHSGGGGSNPWRSSRSRTCERGWVGGWVGGNPARRAEIGARQARRPPRARPPFLFGLRACPLFLAGAASLSLARVPCSRCPDSVQCTPRGRPARATPTARLLVLGGVAAVELHQHHLEGGGRRGRGEGRIPSLLTRSARRRGIQ